MSLLGPAYPWEYRWRIPILFLSQPVLALLHFWATGSQGIWYAPSFGVSVAVGATILAACGLAVRVWGTSFLSAAIVTSFSPCNDRLITGGPFAITRNPLYLGTLLIFAGYGLFFGVWSALGFVMLHCLRYERIVRYEESILRAEWGVGFEDYMRDVPRWCPNKFSLRNCAGPFLTIDGLLGNVVFVGMFLGFFVSALWGTLVPLVYWEGAGLGAAAIMLLWPRARQKQQLTAEAAPHVRRHGESDGSIHPDISQQAKPPFMPVQPRK